MEYSYEEKEIKLMYALLEREGMQSIADTASEAFQNPVFICDLGYKIICCSDQDAAYDGFWEHLTNHKYSGAEEIAQLMRSGDLARIYESDEPRTGCYPFARHPFLAARIRDGSRPLGHICVYGCRREFDEQDKKLLLLLCKVVSYEMLYKGLSTQYKTPYYTLLEDLLDGTLSDPEELETRLKCLKLKLHQPMFLAVVQFKSKVVQTSIFYIREYLLRKLSGCMSIVYKDRLILLIPKKVPPKNLLEELFSGYEYNIDYKIGISDRIASFMNLKVYYEQALHAVKISELLKLDNRVCLYRQLYIYQILLCASRETDLRYLCDPVILEIQEYDRVNHTEYLKDLELYLSCGKNISAAAQKACVHKNSMYYRISKIEEKFSFTLDDESTCFSLELSLKILKLLNG